MWFGVIFDRSNIHIVTFHPDKEICIADTAKHSRGQVFNLYQDVSRLRYEIEMWLVESCDLVAMEVRCSIGVA